MPNEIQTPATREVLIVGRVDGGALDPETGQRAPGGVAYLDVKSGETVRLVPGETAEVPVRVAQSLLADGFAVDPHAVEPEAEVERDADGSLPSDDDESEES